MSPSSRTPEGDFQRCWACGKDVVIEPSMPTGDAPCPHCGQLIWHDLLPDNRKQNESSASRQASAITAGKPGVIVETFARSVRLCPENLMYRQALRGSEYILYSQNGTGAFMSGLRVQRIRRRIRAAKSRNDWDTVDRLAEDGLRINPWNTELNVDLGLACRERGRRDVARYAFECALNSSPDRDDIRELINGLTP